MSLSKRNVGIPTIVYIFKECFSITEEKSFITLAPGGSLSGCGTWVKIGIATIIADCPNEAIELKTKSFFTKLIILEDFYSFGNPASFGKAAMNKEHKLFLCPPFFHSDHLIKSLDHYLGSNLF
jgi:hypothetical protein